MLPLADDSTPLSHTTRLCLAAMLTVALLAAAQAVAREVTSATSSVCLDQEVRVRNLDLPVIAAPNPSPFDTMRYTYLLNLDAISPTVGGPRRKGRVNIELICNGPNGVSMLASRNKRFGRNGNIDITGTVPPGMCDAIGVEVEGRKGNQRLDEGTTIVQRLSMTPEFNARPCTDNNVLCLRDERFRVEVDWRDFSGRSGSGVAFPASDESGYFYFFDADNSEMVIKVLDQCDFNNHFWVFAGSLTNVEFDVTVTDTQVGQTRAYGNPFGGPAPAITDTQAFATCP